MKILQLKYFQTVCKYNNITKASEELFVSQPAISSSIKELEEELGVELFSRQNNKITLTDDGSFFLEKVNQILDDLNHLAYQMKDLGNNKNLIRIGMPPMIGTFLFPIMFKEYTRIHPEIKMEMQEFGSLQTIDMVDNGDLDVAITVVEEGMSDKFNVIPLMDTELVFATSVKHPYAKLDKISFSMLENEPLILMKEGSFQNIAIKDRFASINIQPKVILFSSQLYTIQEFLAEGIAGAFLFKEVAEMANNIASIKMEDPIRVKLGLIWKKNAFVYKDVESFISFASKYNYRNK